MATEDREISNTFFPEDEESQALLFLEIENATLMSFLFERIQSYFAFAATEDRRVRESFQEGWDWVTSERGDDLSFDSICSSLSVEPIALRLGLVNIVFSSLDV